MIVVGYLYNTNGMATWCIETAYALHEAGENVLLVHAPSVKLPANLPFKTLCFSFNSAKESVIAKVGLMGKMNSFLNVFSNASTGFSYKVYEQLTQDGKKVHSFFLNQSNMIDPRVPIPQYVCSWVYPFNINYYLKTAFLSLEQGSIKNKILTIANAIGFYRKDKASFKAATKVLALTPAMQQNLLQQNYKAVLLSPCCAVEQNVKKVADTVIERKIKVIMCALDLSSKRKNLTWVMEQLNSLKDTELEIILIGRTGEDMEQLIAVSPHTIIQKGILTREEIINEYNKADIFLFASLSDDWGYVLTEAMSKGLAVLAPYQHPFNYIVGNEDYLFEPGSKHSFLEKFCRLLKNKDALHNAQIHCYQRTKQFFSRENFVSASKGLSLI